MLIHLTPRMYACRTNEVCSLIDLNCAELGLSLKGDNELTARRPYPNKNYLVACRKAGQKAMNGILLETQSHLREFTVVTRWAVAASHVATHQVRYIVLDEEFDTISESMTLWYGTASGRFKSRWPITADYGSPAATQPCMEAFPRVERRGEVKDVTDKKGALIERSEVFQLHTLERERLMDLTHSHDDRIPVIDHAFPVERY